MVPRKKINANRKNALKSTGPKSKEGKARSRFNAVKSGIFAKHRVLPAEDQQAYDALEQSVFEDLKPQGVVAAALADQILADLVRLQRLDRVENALLRAAVHRRTVIREYPEEYFELVSELDDDYDTAARALAEDKSIHPKLIDLEEALELELCSLHYNDFDKIDERRRAILRDLMKNCKFFEEMREQRMKTIDIVGRDDDSE